MIFTAALGLEDPWYIKKVYFELVGDKKILHINIDHRRPVNFDHEGTSCSVYDHQDRTWKHLYFFQHECYLHAPLPRVTTKEGKVRTVEVPWAGRGGSFTLLFEDKVMSLVRGGMSASSAGEELSISAKRVFRIIERRVNKVLADTPLEAVKELSVDETSISKGHTYMTVMCDREKRTVVGLAPGKDKKAFTKALDGMELRGSQREDVRCVTMDMSRSYIYAAAEELPGAAIVFDRFHIVKKMNEAVDSIRRNEQKEYQELKKSRYLWLKNGYRLSESQRERVSVLSGCCPNIGEAYRLKELLRHVLDDARHSKLLTPLNEWIKEAWASELPPLRNFVNMLHRHWYGIKNYFEKVADNGFAERVNLKIQEIKRVAKGYRNVDNFSIMIYFHLGGLKLSTH